MLCKCMILDQRLTETKSSLYLLLIPSLAQKLKIMIGKKRKQKETAQCTRGQYYGFTAEYCCRLTKLCLRPRINYLDQPTCTHYGGSHMARYKGVPTVPGLFATIN